MLLLPSSPSSSSAYSAAASALAFAAKRSALRAAVSLSICSFTSALTRGLALEAAIVLYGLLRLALPLLGLCCCCFEEGSSNEMDGRFVPRGDGDGWADADGVAGCGCCFVSRSASTPAPPAVLLSRRPRHVSTSSSILFTSAAASPIILPAARGPSARSRSGGSS